MSARYPAVITLSMQELARHGGGSGPHAHGWGVAFISGRDVQLVKEPHAATDSACLRFLQEQAPRGEQVLAHVRKATQGAISLANTQPFRRELGGRLHVFAHNGDLKPDDGDLHGSCRPIGETDSERAFCRLLADLQPLWLEPLVGQAQTEEPTLPSIAARVAVLRDFAAALRPRGPANFLYSDGELLIAHGHRRTQADGTIRPPGLHWLERRCPSSGCLETAGLRIDRTAAREAASDEAEEQRVVLVASVPLSDEAWQPLAEGELLVLQQGRVVSP